VFLLYFNDLT